MLRKGWYLKYLNSKIEEYESLVGSLEDSEHKKLYESILSAYYQLYTTLIFQKGTLGENDVCVQDYLDAVNEVSNQYKYNKSTTTNLNNIAKSLIELEPIPEQEYESTVKRDDAINIVGDFIKDTFGKENYKDFRDWFKKRKSFILFDQICDTPCVTAIKEDEIFIQIPDITDVTLINLMAHEFGHAYRYGKNFIFIEDLVSEYDSFSYEIRILLWMIKNNIYKNDAYSALLELMSIIENNVKMRYINGLYKLSKIKDPKYFEQRVSDLDLYTMMNVEDIYDIGQLVLDSMEYNAAAYMSSFISVVDSLDNPNFLEYYKYVINNIGKVKDKEILKNIGINNITNLTKYKSLRNNLINKSL